MKRWELLLRAIIEEERPLPWSIAYIGAPLADLDTAFKRFMLLSIATSVWGAEIKRESDGEDHIVYTILLETDVLGTVSLWRLSQYSCDLKVLPKGKNDELLKQCVIPPLHNWLAQNGSDENDWPQFWEFEASKSLTQSEDNSESKPTLIAQLSDREREVLQEIVNGSGQTQVAKKLNIQVSTVKTQKRRIAEKLGLEGDAADQKLRAYGLKYGMKKR